MRQKAAVCVRISILACLLLLALAAGQALAAPVGYSQEVDHAITASSDGAVSSAVMTLLVYNSSGTNGNNVLYVGSNCRSDFNDILINDSTDTVTFPHRVNWTASDANHVCIEYNITTGVPLGGTTIKIYYGYSAASNHEDLQGVYSFYDDFTGGSLDTDIWAIEQGAGSITVSDGELKLTGAATNPIINSVAVFGPGKVMYVRAKAGDVNNMPVLGLIQNPYSPQNMAGLLYASGTGANKAYFATGVGGDLAQEVNTLDNITVYHVYKFIWGTASSLVYQDGTLVSTHTNPSQYVYSEGDVSAQFAGTTGVGVVASIDWAYCMPYTSNAPTDGGWGIPNSDILQTIPFTLYKIDIFGLSIGPVQGATVTVTDINGNAVKNGVTGSDGSASFQLFRNTYYNIRFVKAGESIDKTWSGYPSDIDGYTIYIYPWDLIWSPGRAGPDDENDKIVSFLTAQLNESDNNNGDITVYYNDTGGHTTTTTFNVYKRLNMTTDLLVGTFTSTDGNFSHTFTIEDVSGEDYKVTIVSANTVYGTVKRTFTWTFPGIKYEIPGLPLMAYAWIGFLVPSFVALTVSQRNLKFGPIVFCAMSWGFNTLGWMAQFGAGYTLILAVSTFFSIIFIFNQKAREGGY